MLWTARRLLSEWDIDRLFWCWYIISHSDSHDLDIVLSRQSMHYASPRTIVAGHMRGVNDDQDLHPAAGVGVKWQEL